MPDDAPERKLACWLSRDATHSFRVFRWSSRPLPRQEIGGKKVGWCAPGGYDGDMGISFAQDCFGICPEPGQAIPIYYVAGEPLSEDD